MAATRRELLTQILEDLLEAEFKRFKWKLHEIQAGDTKRHIPRGILEKADRLRTADLLLDYFGESVAATTTVWILNLINKRELAAELEAKLQVIVRTEVSHTGQERNFDGSSLQYPSTSKHHVLLEATRAWEAPKKQTCTKNLVSHHGRNIGRRFSPCDVSALPGTSSNTSTSPTNTQVQLHTLPAGNDVCNAGKPSHLSTHEASQGQIADTNTLQDTQLMRAKLAKIQKQLLELSLLRKGDRYYISEKMSPWDMDQDPFGIRNHRLTSKLHEFVQGGNAEASTEEINVVAKTYWRNRRRNRRRNLRRNLRRQKVAAIWDQRKLEARRRKSKANKCRRRLAAVDFTDLAPTEKQKIKGVFMSLPIEDTQSTEESEEEDHPFEGR